MADLPGADTPTLDTPVVANTTPAPDVTATPDAQVTPPTEPQEKLLPQSQVDQIVQRERAKARRQAERELREMNERIEQEVARRLGPQKPDQQKADGPPKQENFNDYDSFIRAEAKYHAEQAAKAQFEAWQQQQQGFAQRQADMSLAQSLQPKIKAAAEKYPDFDEVAKSFDSAHPALQAAMLESDMTGDLYYYFGAHPEELERVHKLSPIGMVREVANLEAKLRNPPPKAPPPPPPIKPTDGTAAVSKDVFKDALSSDAAWEKFMKERRKARGR